MTKIIVESGPLRGKVFVLPPGKPITVGRDSQCSIPIQDRQASRQHFMLIPASEKYVLQDRDSRNGTFVNGKKVSKCHLRAGDIIRAGGTHFSLLGAQGDPLIGKTLSGYHIEHRLGRGGMGTVYRARQISLDRIVALKILSQEYSEDEDFIKRFTEEARSAGKLSHPNVVQVFDAGRHENYFFLSMEFMAGGSLQQLIDREGKLEPGKLLPMIVDAAQALVWAEQIGIVHRDIKPDNLMIDGDGRVKIGDFGIAADRNKSKTLYEGGKVLGTPVFMAPEQAEGKPIDQRADIYALGATLYLGLSGEFPFDGETPIEIILKKVKEDAPSLLGKAPGIAPDLAAAVAQMLARDPAHRIAHAQEALDTLIDLIDRQGESRPRGTFLRRLGKPRALAAAAAAAILIALLIYFLRPQGVVPEIPAASLAAANVQAIAGAPPSGPELPETQDAPPPPGTGTEAAAALPLRELQQLETAWKNRQVTGEAALARLEELRKRDAGEAAGTFARDLSARITAAIKEDQKKEQQKSMDEGLSSMRELVETRIDPLTTAGSYAEAAELLENFARDHPLQKDLLDRKVRTIEELAGTELMRIRKQAGEQIAAGNFAGGRKALESIAPKLFGTPRTEAQAELQQLDQAEQEFKSASDQLQKARTAIQECYRTTRFQPAEDALKAIRRPCPAAIEAQVQTEERELALFRDVFSRLDGHLQKLQADKTLLPLTWVTDRGATRSESRRILEHAGLAVKLQPRSGAPESISLPDLDAAVLFGWLKASPAAGEPSAQNSQEALGVFLLHAGGAVKAWKLLTELDDKAASKVYRKRLEASLEEQMKRRIDLASEQVAAKIQAHEKAGGPLPGEWQELQETIGGWVRETSVLPSSKELRADLAGLYLELYLAGLAGATPQSFFRGKVKPINPQGLLRITYDFRTDDQVQDFTPAKSGADLRIPRKGLLYLKGDCRYLRGEPFQHRLRISGIAAEYNKTTPNINMAFWTRELDTFPARAINSFVFERALEGPSVLTFAIGYFGETSSTTGGKPYFSLPGGNDLPLPANVILQSERDLNRHAFNLDNTQFLWGNKSLRGYRGPLNFDFSTSPEAGISWTVEGDKLPVKNLQTFEEEKTARGSITLRTLNQEVYFSFLEIEGQLDPLWMEREKARLGIDLLKQLEPAYPFTGLKSPLESTRRGAFLEGSGAGRAGTRFFFDSFNGKLDPAWKIQNEDASHYSLSKKKGLLTLTTQRGGMVGAQSSYKNLFLIDAPRDDGFDATIRFVDFQPAHAFQQLALVFFNDADNFVKGSLEWARGRRIFSLLREREGSLQFLESPIDPSQQSGSMWMKLRKQGQLYSLYTSFDGRLFSLQGELFWENPPPRSIGIIAKNSDAGVPDLDAGVDSFEVRVLPGGEAEPAGRK